MLRLDASKIWHTTGISPRPNVICDLYFNDLPETVRSDVYLFADDTKIFKVLNSDNDKDILQSDLTNLMDWSEKWLLSFHPDKCKHIHITRERGDPTDHRYYRIQGEDLEVIESEKDIGFT